MFSAQKMRRNIEIKMHYKEREIHFRKKLNLRMTIKTKRREYTREDIYYDCFLKKCQNMVKFNISTLTLKQI
jgi:hypothetical protein